MLAEITLGSAGITTRCCAMYVMREAHDRNCAHIFSMLCKIEALEGIKLKMSGGVLAGVTVRFELHV